MHAMTFTLSERVTYGTIGMCFLIGFVGACVSIYLLATAKPRRFPWNRWMAIWWLFVALSLLGQTGRQLLYGL
jgi:hypothetical protein